MVPTYVLDTAGRLDQLLFDEAVKQELAVGLDVAVLRETNPADGSLRNRPNLTDNGAIVRPPGS